MCGATLPSVWCNIVTCVMQHWLLCVVQHCHMCGTRHHASLDAHVTYLWHICDVPNIPYCWRHGMRYDMDHVYGIMYSWVVQQWWECCFWISCTTRINDPESSHTGGWHSSIVCTLVNPGHLTVVALSCGYPPSRWQQHQVDLAHHTSFVISVRLSVRALSVKQVNINSVQVITSDKRLFCGL